MSGSSQELSQRDAPFSRRSLLKTAAWATPVVAIAVASPLASASPLSAQLATAVSITKIGTMGQTGTFGTSLGPLVVRNSSSTSAQCVITDTGNLGYSTGIITAVLSIATDSTITGLTFYKWDGSAIALNSTITTTSGTWTVTDINSKAITLSLGAFNITTSPTTVKFPPLAVKITAYTLAPRVYYDIVMAGIDGSSTGSNTQLTNRPA